MKTSSKLAVAAAALLAASAVPASVHAYTLMYGGNGICNGQPQWISGHRRLEPRCAGGNTLSLTSGVQADIAESAWRQWWHMDTTNPAIWIDRWGACTNTGINWGDGINVAWLSYDAFSYGRAGWVANCGFFGRPDATTMDIEVNAWTLDRAPRCRATGYTEDGTWVHELGHPYGYAHFDDWLSTMNTSTPDVTSCRSDRAVRPSSDAQHGHHAIYGLPDARDAGGSPLVQACALSNSACATTPGSTVYIPVGSGWQTASVQFTSMNMRNAWPYSTIPVTVWLSSDDFVNGGDNRILDVGLNETFGGAIYAYTLNIGFSPSLIPVGTTKCVLVQWDANGTVSEYDESDNVTDTNFCFYRL
jgi:hypothetical protein